MTGRVVRRSREHRSRRRAGRAGGQGLRCTAAVALLLAVVLTACQSSSGNAQDKKLPAASVNQVDPATLADGGTLRWGINELPAQWNPHHANGNLATVQTVMGALLPSPWRTGSDADSAPDPDYVEDVDVRTDPRQVVTLRLNPKARWSNGDPITWRDYAAMAEALSGRDPEFQVAGQTGYDRISSVRAGRDRFEVVVAFSKPFADYASLFRLLLPAAYTEDAERFNSGYLDRIPVTAGPFGSAKFDRTAKSIAVARSADWWGDRARLDRIVFRAMAPEALEAAFLDGGVDLAPLPVDSAAAKRVDKAADGEVRAARAPDFRHLTLNGESPLLSDVDVRHAVFLGVNRRAVAESAFSGLDWRPEPTDHHFLLPGQDGYTDNSGKWGAYDPEKAREVLEGAGWRAAGDGEPRRKGGKELRLRFTIPQGFAPAQSEAELVQSMLAEIGVAVRIDSVPRDALFADHILPGDYDMVALVSNGSGFPVSQFLQQWSTPLKAENGDEQWRANVGRIGSPAIDAAMDEALGSLDPEAALASINDADRLLWDTGHTLPLYQRPELVATRTGLANVGAPGFADIDYAAIGYPRGG
ncbi:peptide/nickel transport system substrate-binding protein [Murinocardiopsis flavida]|uniref:Peptide/nickel transport system substrate-binding protein n=1 Tax=Murinocardiopsis flavida TaxID=645275 RepID=A0A2P8DUU4_9ACTN|nr:peptide/nickel transport system substrate-binding protein [Murinocardiopsis flavida]